MHFRFLISAHSSFYSRKKLLREKYIEKIHIFMSHPFWYGPQDCITLQKIMPIPGTNKLVIEFQSIVFLWSYTDDSICIAL